MDRTLTALNENEMKNPVHIAILDLYNQFPNEGMRCIKQLLQELTAINSAVKKVDYFDVRAKNEFPDPKDYDIFISSGGPGDPHLTGEPWEKEYVTLIDHCLENNKKEQKKKYVFFICHSFQVIIQHWGLAEVNKRKSTSFGVMPVHRIGMGLEEPIFDGLDEPFYVVDSRDYQVVQPNRSKLHDFGASVICLEKFRPTIPLERAIMGVRFSKEMIGTQFHPEADPVGMAHYLKQEEKKKIVISHHGEDKYFEMLEHLYDDDKIKRTHNTILPKFLDFAIAELQQREEVIGIKHQRVRI
jgi:GMP synthase-like glutamine amidotransferase